MINSKLTGVEQRSCGDEEPMREMCGTLVTDGTWLAFEP